MTPTTPLPFPLVENIIEKADPLTLFRLMQSNSVLAQRIFRLRGLQVDTLILTHAPLFLQRPRLCVSRNPTKAAELGLVLKVPSGLFDPAILSFLQNVTVHRRVLLKRLRCAPWDELRIVRRLPACELAVAECQLNDEEWHAVLYSTPPPTHSRENPLSGTQRQQKRHLHHVALHTLTLTLEPKVLAEFIEQRMQRNASVELSYHFDLSSKQIGHFERTLIRCMNRGNGDWAMVGHKGLRRRLLIKLGAGSQHDRFERDFRRYVESQKSTLGENGRKLAARAVEILVAPFRALSSS